MKKILGILAVLFILIMMITPVAFADKGADKPFDIPYDKQLTDKEVIRQLERNGVDTDRVMLSEDYTAENPTTQKYIDLNTGETVAIIDSLPHVNEDGEDISTSWSHFTYSGNDWDAGVNLFTASVKDTSVKVENNGERCWWNPELYLNGNRIYPVSSKATIGNDPYNSNYKGNILTWDYGICIREVRLIQGSVFERWVFKSNPNGEIKVIHRQEGRIKLALGYMNDQLGVSYPVVVKQQDWEIVSADTFDMPNIVYPLYLSASMTFYSTTASGGAVGTYPTPAAANLWATLVANPGDWGPGTGYWGSVFSWSTYPTANRYNYLMSSAFIFDTSGLNDAVTITSSQFGLFGYAKSDPLSDGGLKANIYATTTLYPNILDKTDYSRRTATAYCATPITYTNWSTTGYNVFSLNAAGLAGISLTSTTKIAVRDVDHDVGGALPTWGSGYWNSGFFSYYPAQGIGYAPFLIVTYISSNPAITATDATNIAATSARLNSIITSDGGETCEIRWGYNTVSGAWGTYPAGQITSWTPGYAIGDHPYFDLTGLNTLTPYFYRVQIKNSVTTITSSEITFTTLTGTLQPPTSFVAIPASTSVELMWLPATGASTTLVRVAYDTYPALTTDGLLVYNGSERTKTYSGISGLENGKTFYFSAWSVSGGNTSAAKVSTLATTLLATAASVPNAPPDMPSGFTQVTDSTIMSKLPGYDGINQMADSLAVPRGTMWLIVSLGLVLGMTVAAGLVGGLTMGVIAGGAASVGFVAIGVVPSGFIAITAIFAIGYGIWQWREA